MSDLIDIDYFKKLDLRVAQIMKAEKIEGTDKLLKLEIKMGDENRQLVAGIALHYSPDQLINKKIIVIKNLKEATIRGVTSQGMLLAASDDQGNLSILSPDKDIATGSSIS
ncbi:MAG: methionine--tRNA ligase subunit beta [Spirochaetes bacterium]|nr:methionine--tRNA ligase subunit beta [Spirochaetota bacterium]